MNIKKRSLKKWTKEEIEYLHEFDGIISVKQQGKHLDRSISSVQHKRSEEQLTNRNLYSNSDINLLKELRQHYSLKELAEIFNRSLGGIRSVCYRNKIYGNQFYYSNEDDIFIQSNLDTMTHKEIAKVLGRSESAISTRAASKGWYRPSATKRIKIYDEFIRDNYQNMTHTEIANILDETPSDIKLRIQALGLTKDVWTTEQIKILKELYPTVKAEDISEKIDKSIAAIIHKANRLEIKIISRNILWLPHELEQLKLLTAEGHSRLYIGSLLGKSDSSVGQRQKQLGIFEYDDMFRIKYDGMIFDSKEERDVYIILRDAGFNIIKLAREDHLTTTQGKRVEPDFLIFHNNRIIYCEYFGLFVDNPSIKRQIEY